jgi:hypothetical protein
MRGTQRLDAEEKQQLATLGYVVRERAFDPGEVAQMGADCEAMVTHVTSRSVDRQKHTLGSYMFQLEKGLVTIVKWEPAFPDVVQGVEPFAHFDESLRNWAMDARFIEPMKDVVGGEELALFTEKLNVKRARTGGPIALHQDYPYWTEISDGAGEIATAIVFLDDTTRQNGCLEVLPGSHQRGVWPRKKVEGFGANEMELEGFDESRLVPLELPAGSVVFLGSLLVHRSLPNGSDQDRRALLYSYQPAGRRLAIESFMQWAGR